MYHPYRNMLEDLKRKKALTVNARAKLVEETTKNSLNLGQLR